jgi:predicted O-methyltransferase YrrM
LHPVILIFRDLAIAMLASMSVNARSVFGRNLLETDRRNGTVANQSPKFGGAPMQRNADVPKATFIRHFHLTRLSRPSHVQRLYRAIATTQARRIVEIGVGDGRQALNMIALALRSPSEKPLRYTGIDLFEARPDDSSFSLKQAHQMLHSRDYEVRLVPGDVATALTRCANELRGTDMIVVSSKIDARALDAAWHLLPRMLHKDSQVWIERDGRRYDVIGPAELRQRSMSQATRRAA